MTDTTTDIPCGCHGWGYRPHDGHCCITDFHTKTTDAPHCHNHPREGTTPMTHTHTATAGYIQTGDTITLPCGEEITVSRWESGPLPGEMSVYYDLPHGADRVILDSHQPIQFHGPATIGRVQRNGG